MKQQKAVKAEAETQLANLKGDLEGLGEAAQQLPGMLQQLQQLPEVLEEVQRLAGALQIALRHTNGLRQELVDQRRVFLHMLSEMTDATPEELGTRYEDVYNLLKSEEV